MGKAEKHINKYRNSNNLLNPFKNRTNVNFAEMVEYFSNKDKLVKIVNRK